MRREQLIHEPERSRRETELTPDQLERGLVALREALAENAKELQRRGFPVDTELRLDPEQMHHVSNEERAAQINQVAVNENRWREEKEALDPMERSDKEFSEKMGELLEIVITLSINTIWFKRRLVAVRTSRYDDYENKVDNLIIDTETGEVIAAIDEATAGGLGKKNRKQVRWQIENGARIAHGIGVDDNNAVYQTSYDALPTFLVSVDSSELLTLARDAHMGKINHEEIIHRILEQLRDQAWDAGYGDPEGVTHSARRRSIPQVDQVRDPRLKEAYQRAYRLFEELRP